MAALLVGSATPGQVIPHPHAEGEALIIPPDSPVRFRGFDKRSGYGHFKGRFVLTGTFSYGCGSNCADYEGPLEKSDLHIGIVPDPELAARLPNWKIRNNDMMIFINSDEPLAAAIANPEQRAALLAGKISSLQGRIAIVVDNFQAGLECDSATFTARLVAIAEAPRAAPVELSGDYGCM